MIYLLRHAHSVTNPDIPEPEWPLSPKGREQAKKLVPQLMRLSISAIYTSPFKRARSTVKPFAEAADIQFTIDKRLREKKLTDQWLDDHGKAIRNSWDDFKHTLPRGESHQACQQRVCECIQELKDKHTGDSVLFSSHGNAISLYLNSLDSGFGFQKWQSMPKPALYKVHDETFTRVALNIRS